MSLALGLVGARVSRSIARRRCFRRRRRCWSAVCRGRRGGSAFRRWGSCRLRARRSVCRRCPTRCVLRAQDLARLLRARAEEHAAQALDRGSFRLQLSRQEGQGVDCPSELVDLAITERSRHGAGEDGFQLAQLDLADADRCTTGFILLLLPALELTSRGAHERNRYSSRGGDESETRRRCAPLSVCGILFVGCFDPDARLLRLGAVASPNPRGSAPQSRYRPPIRRSARWGHGAPDGGASRGRPVPSEQQHRQLMGFESRDGALR